MTHGMVCAPQPEAVEAGAMALKQGGNAVDAAIACALVQTAVHPQMCGIAGFGSMHLYLAQQKQHYCIDFHRRAPVATRADMWEDIIIAETEDGFGSGISPLANCCNPRLNIVKMASPSVLKWRATGIWSNQRGVLRTSSGSGAFRQRPGFTPRQTVPSTRRGRF